MHIFVFAKSLYNEEKLQTHPGRNDDSMMTEYALYGIPTYLIIDGETGAIIFRDRMKDIATVIPALFQ